MNSKFKGVLSALVTPFQTPHGQMNGHMEVDYASLKTLVKYQLQNGINGFVVNGTTAESPTLRKEEVIKIFSTVRELVGPGFPIILGTGSNSTEKTIQDTQLAYELGADAALVVVPYYNKPPQRGLIQHFKTVANSTTLPIILYNVPGRTITSLSLDTVVELSKCKNIIGIKEASGDLKFDQELKSRLPKDFIFLSGDDGTYIDFLKIGGDGLISVMSNLITKECVEWTRLVRAGSISDAEASFSKYKGLINGMYIEANPIPLKWMLAQKKIIASAALRLPLCELDEKFHTELTTLMKSTGLV